MFFCSHFLVVVVAGLIYANTYAFINNIDWNYRTLYLLSDFLRIFYCLPHCCLPPGRRKPPNLYFRMDQTKDFTHSHSENRLLYSFEIIQSKFYFLHLILLSVGSAFFFIILHLNVKTLPLLNFTRLFLFCYLSHMI